ncbi:O-antigen ligase family protein [Loktanella sp. M215]|uniref:O-antigen ligase family protein n=1 Tax=Loktanella sp. M215 TaxID=2675431 RepID=UPI001F20FF6E|nr:O-antigen ligase family protein [Loktanella sp. M215]MCF7702208.1 O-antigen ligase domain-containing protein [Loktanella sp. M215]
MTAIEQTVSFGRTDIGQRPNPFLAATQIHKLPRPVLLYLLTVVLPIGFNAGPLYMTTLRLFLIVMILPLAFRLLTGAYGKIILTDFLFVFHILWGAVAIAANNPGQVVQQMGSVGVEFLGAYMIGRAYIRTPETFMALSRTLIVLVLCTTPFAIHETLTGRPLIIEILRKIPGMTSVAIVFIDKRMGLERVQAVFAHPIHYGLFCSVAFSLCFVALRGTMTTLRRYTTSIIIALSGFLALSSGALTAIVMQFGLIIWAAMFRTVKARWWLLVGLFVFAYVTIDLLSNRSPIKVFMSYATFSAHNAYWRGIIFEWGMKSVWAHPLYGIGLNDWVRPWYMYSGSMDNFWLVMAVRYGIPGFLFLVVGYLAVIFRVMRRDFTGQERMILLRRAWVFTFLGLTFTLCTVHVWTNIYSFVFFMFGAGVWFIFHEPTADGSDDPDQTADEPDPTSAFQRPSAAHGTPYSRFPHRPAVQRVPS